MSRTSDRLFIVTPVFNDRPSLLKLLDHFRRLHPQMPITRVVIVEDGSLDDQTRAQHLTGFCFDIELVTLARNVGHQRAIAIGLAHVANSGNADQVVVLDSDGEDRPEDVPALVERIKEKRCDVVVAQRRKRHETLSFRIFYQIYRWVFELLTGQRIRFGNFCVLNDRAVQRLVNMQELWMHLPATVIASRLTREHVDTDRGARFFGSSKMNYVSLVVHGLRSVAVFVENVLTRIIVLCVFLSASSLVLITLAVALKIFGLATPGWMTAAVGALIGFLAQTATLALVSILLAINTRTSPGLSPAKASRELIDSIDAIQAAQ